MRRAMADRYSRISARFWIDTKGWGERNQLVALYLLTNTHSTMEGLYHLPIGYLCADLKLTADEAHAALKFIGQAGVVSYDPHAEVVFVRKALKHGAPTGDNHIKGAIARLQSVPWSPLWNEFAMASECHSKGLAKAIRKAWPSAFETPVADSEPTHSNNQTQAQEQSSTSLLKDAVGSVEGERAHPGNQPNLRIA